LKRILIVEDESDIIFTLKIILEQNGFELYREIRKIDDKVKICFLTASEINYEELKKAVFPSVKDTKCFIRKPVENEALLMQLNKMLE